MQEKTLYLRDIWSDGKTHESDPQAIMRASIAFAVRAINDVREADERLYREWLLLQLPRPKAMAAGR